MLHVANGSTTTRLIKASGLSGRTLSWADSLYDGPVPDVPDKELVRIRAIFHDSPEQPLAGNIDAFTAWRRAIDDRGAYDELVLWFEHDLFDQLNLIHVLSYLGRGHAITKPVSLVTLDRFDGMPDFKGLGQLTPADIAGLFGIRQPVTESQIVLAKRAWGAFRASDPRSLEALLVTDSSALPFLAAALRRHLEEFPSDVDGLSRSERRILEQAGRGVELKRAFQAAHDGEHAYHLTDTSFLDRVNELAATTPPLLALSGSAKATGAAPNIPDASMTLTPAGRDIEAGNADRVRMCGIDRWIGGVHLSGRGPVWRWSARGGQLVKA
jgi:hypothetical protein